MMRLLTHPRGLRTAIVPRLVCSLSMSVSNSADSVGETLQPLLSTSGGRWELGRSGEALECTFQFKTFARTWDFMTAVALQCKLHSHHPEWSNSFNTVFMRWTTHHPKGLSPKDVTMAQISDSLAREFGALQHLASEANGDLKSLTDAAVPVDGNCCAPKQ